MIVQTYYNFWDEQSVENTVKYAVDSGVDIVSLLFKQDEDETDVKSGQVFFPNSPYSLANPEELGNKDLVQYFIQKAHEAGLHVKAWIPQFHDQMAAEKSDDWKMRAIAEDGTVSIFTGSGSTTEYFVNPIHEDVQNYELEFIKYVCENYDIDSVVLDWVRFDSFNMDLGDYTREKYKSEKGEDPISFDFSVEDNTNYEKLNEWNEWRTDIMAAYVKKVREAIDPKIKLGAYILSPYWTECGQDVAKFKDYVDFVAPMAYFKDFNEKISWVYEEGGIVDLSVQKLGKESGVIPVLDTTSTNSQYEKILTNLAQNFPEIDTISIFYWSCWDETWEILKTIKNLVELPDDQEEITSDGEKSEDSLPEEEISKEQTSEDVNHDNENNNQNNNDDDDLNNNDTTIIIVVVVVVVVVLIAGIITAYFIIRKKRQQTDDDTAPKEDTLPL